MTFDKLLGELEDDFGRINFRERLIIRKAYDLMTEKERPVKETKDFTYEDYQNASNDITFSQYPFYRGQNDKKQ
jgi:hypothetical protein